MKYLKLVDIIIPLEEFESAWIETKEKRFGKSYHVVVIDYKEGQFETDPLSYSQAVEYLKKVGDSLDA